MHVGFGFDVGGVVFLYEFSVLFYAAHVVVFNHGHANHGGAAETLQQTQRFIQLYPGTREQGSADLFVDLFIWCAEGNVELCWFLA